MLATPNLHRYPFEFFDCAKAFGAENCATFEELFAQKNDWQRRDGAFYRCSLRDATNEIPQMLLRDVARRMREITGHPLTDAVQVTAQQVDPGQSIGVHSDRPLLGYEFVRLVLQLNAEWRPAHGGVLELFASPDQPAAVRLEPIHDVAFGFVLHEGSHHGVTEVSRTRRSLVFNFWHVANSPELREAVHHLFADARFSELPSALDPLAERAESELPEDVTFHASMAALALHRLGYGEATVQAAYCRSAGLAVERALSEEEQAATILADWVARLYLQPFDVQRWEWLSRKFLGTEPFARLSPIWGLCLPTIR